MLKKLLHYDLFDIYRILWLFYALCLLFAVICRILIPLSDMSAFMDIFSRICNGIFISMMINAVVNNIFRVWGRFTANFYRDEGYLTHTLPVTKTELYLSKFLASLISVAATFAVILATLFLTYFTDASASTLMQGMRTFFDRAAAMFALSTGRFLTLMGILLMLQILCVVQVGYTGLMLGHRLPGGRIGLSVLFGLLIYAAVQMLLIVFLLLAGVIGNKELIRLFLENKTPSGEALSSLIIFADIGYGVLTVLLTVLNIKIFKKGVDLD